MPNPVYLAFDFGTKRIGLAVGQSITKTATPLTSIISYNGTPNWQQLDKIVKEWQPTSLIVGLALQPDGKDSPTSLKARHLGKLLQQKYQLSVHYIEERLTSVAAKERVTDNQKDLDALAAAIILESWMNDAI